MYILFLCPYLLELLTSSFLVTFLESFWPEDTRSEDDLSGRILLSDSPEGSSDTSFDLIHESGSSSVYCLVTSSRYGENAFMNMNDDR